MLFVHSLDFDSLICLILHRGAVVTPTGPMKCLCISSFIDLPAVWSRSGKKAARICLPCANGPYVSLVRFHTYRC